MVTSDSQIRPADMALPEGTLSSARPDGLGRHAVPDDVVLSPSIDGHAAHVSVAGVVPGAWTWGVVESCSSDGLWVGLGGGARGHMFILECDHGSSASPVDQLAVLNDVATGRRYAVGSPVLCVVRSVDHTSRQVHLSCGRARDSIASAAKAVSALQAAAAKAAKDAARDAAAKAAKATPGKKKKGGDAGGAAVVVAPPSGREVVAAAVTAARAVAAKKDDFSVGVCVFARVSENNTVSGLGKARKAKKAAGDAAGDGSGSGKGGAVSKLGAPCTGVDLKLQLSQSLLGSVCATHSDEMDHWSDQPFKQFVVGQVCVRRVCAREVGWTPPSALMPQMEPPVGACRR